MADKARIVRAMALAMAAPLILMVPAGAASALTGKPSRPAQVWAPQGKTAAGQVALFKAAPSGASPVTSYGWKLSGPGVLSGSYKATCSTHTSEMETSFSRAGVMHVTLHISYASGASSTVTRTVVVGAGRVRAAAKNARATQWLLCLRGPTDPAVQPVANGGPPIGCQDEYFDGPIDAIGCFTVLPSYNKIPAAERALLCPVIKCTKATVVPALLPLLSKDIVRLNGIDIAPATALVIDQNDAFIVSPKATASMLNGLLPLRTGQLKLAEFARPLFSANLTQLLAQYPALAAALNLSGFQVSGQLTVSLAYQWSVLKASITLPGSFTDSGGRPVTSSARMIASDQNGLVVQTLLIALPSADFGGSLEFDQLKFCYQQHVSEAFCEKKTGVNFGSYEGTSASSWNATAKINILGTEINAAPTAVDPEQGIGFVNGQFDFAGATVAFNPAIPLGSSGVSLNSLSGSVALNPTRLQGSVGLTAGDLVTINGQMFMVFASPSQPYTFTGHEVGATGMPTPTVHAFAIAVGGTVGIVLPVLGNTQMASGYVLYAYPGYLAAGGSVNINLLSGALVVTGGLNGQFSLDNHTFEVDGNVGVTALGWLSMSAQAVVSSVGIGACGSVSTPFGPASAGVGYTWGGSVNAWLGSCDLTPYKVIVTGATLSQIHLRVPAGLPTEMVQVRGSGGNLTISGPDGIRASIGNGSKAFAKPFAIYHVGHITYIAIIKPKAGVYTITAHRGSRISEVLAAQGVNGSVLQHFGVRMPHAA